MSSYLTEAEIEKMRVDDFEKAALGTFGWQSSAEKLKRAADILLDAYRNASSKPGPQVYVEGSRDWERHSDISLIDVYFLLMGLSIENWVKAIVVRYLPASLKVEEKLEKIKKHETWELLEENGIHEFREDYDLLKNLAQYVLWKGKYPVSLKLGDYKEIMVEINRMDNLYKKLYKRQRRERRLDMLKDYKIISESMDLKAFLEAENEIVEFYKKDPDRELAKIMTAYEFP